MTQPSISRLAWIAALGLLTATAPAGAVTEFQKLDGPSPPESFGYSVAASGAHALVGAPGSSSVYAFEWNGTSWDPAQQLLASDAGVLGYAVAIDGDRALLGGLGAAYIFEWSGGTWTETQKLVAWDSGSLWAYKKQVALAGDLAVVAASDDSAYVFRRTGATFAPEQRILPSVLEAASFGAALALSGDRIVAGAPHAGLSDEGAAYVFRRNGSTWSEEQKLLSASPAATGHFGIAVGLAGDQVLVGATQEHSPGYSGSLHVYTWNGASWAHTQLIKEQPSVSYGGFGRSIAIAGERAAIGAAGELCFPTGRGFVFVRSTGTWTQTLRFDPSGPPNVLMGWSSALAHDRALFGQGSDHSSCIVDSAYGFDASSCGNGEQGPSEECDDGNGTSGDGCSATCQLEPCSDTVDNDSDGLVDFPADPGCQNAGAIENPKCQNGLDDDGDTKIDFDGGAAANGGVPLASADPQCTVAWKTKEAAPTCGLGSELALLVALVRRMRRRAEGPTP